MLRKIFFCNYLGGTFLMLLLVLLQNNAGAQIPTCNSNITCPQMYVEIIEDTNFPSVAGCPSTTPCGSGDQFRQLFFKVRLVAYPSSGGLNFDLNYEKINITIEQTITGPSGALGYSFIDAAATTLCHQQTATANGWTTAGGSTDGVSFIADEKTADILFTNNNYPCPDAAVVHFSQTAAGACPPNYNTQCASVDLFTVVVNAYPGEVVQLSVLSAIYEPAGSNECAIAANHTISADNFAVNPASSFSTQNQYLKVQLKNPVATTEGGFTIDVELANDSPGANTLVIDYLEFVVKVAANEAVIIDVPGTYDRPILPTSSGVSDKFIQFIIQSPGWSIPFGTTQFIKTITIKPEIANIAWSATVSLLETNKARVKTTKGSNKACTNVGLGSSKSYTNPGDPICTYNNGGVEFTIEGEQTNDCTYPFTQKVKIGFVDTDLTVMDVLVLLGLEFNLDIHTTGPVSLTAVNFPGSGWLTCGMSGCFSGTCTQVTNGTGLIEFSFCRLETSTTFTIIPDAYIELVFEGAGCIDAISIASLSLKRNGDPNACVPSFNPGPYDGIPVCMGTIFGVAATETGVGVEGVTVELEPESANQPSGCNLTSCPIQSVMSGAGTGPSGAYGFCACSACQYFKITPAKNDNVLNGVTTYDLVLISKHILATGTLNSPYKIIAADANKSGNITTFDIVELRKLILGIYTSLPSNTSWRFVEKSYVFGSNPFIFDEFITNVDNLATPVSQDFVAIKVGDVNNTAVGNRPNGKRPHTMLSWPSFKRSTGDIITIPITYSGTERLDAIQLGLKFDPTVLQLISPSLGALPDWTATAFNLANAGRGEIRSIWLPFELDNPDRYANQGDVLFYLTFKVLSELSENTQILWYDDAILSNAAWNVDGTEYALEHQAMVSKREDELMTNDKKEALSVTCHPNPSSGNLAFGIHSDKTTKGNIALFSPFGVRLLASDVMLNPGDQEVSMHEAAQLPSGVYVWKFLVNGTIQQGHWVKQ